MDRPTQARRYGQVRAAINKALPAPKAVLVFDGPQLLIARGHREVWARDERCGWDMLDAGETAADAIAFLGAG